MKMPADDASGVAVSVADEGADGICVEEEADELFHAESEQALDTAAPMWVKVGLPVALVIAILVSFAIGQYSVSPAELIKGVIRHIQGAVTSDTLSLDKVIFNIRTPRILLVVLVGAALASSGAAFQSMFRNPLVAPDLLGASSGASFGACLGLLLGLPVVVTQLLAFVFGLLAVGIAVFLNRMVKYDRLLGLVLGGILVSTLFESFTSIVKLCADTDNKLPSITYWLMGSFSGTNQRDLVVAVIPIACGLVLLLIERWHLNVLAMGEDEARSLGVNVRRTRLVIIVAATLLASVSVAVSGVIGWVGLVIPHLARAMVGQDNGKLIPTSMLLGAIYLLVVDDVARCLLSVEIPIGILTAIIGVPFFAIVFHHNSKAVA
jgi:iron complex transport system permease protein